MKTRRLAPIALAAAVILGTSGCAMISPQRTQMQYEASDGVNIDAGDVLVRNALIVADEDGTDGNFIASIVNSSSETRTLRLQLGEGAGALEASIRVPANGEALLGVDDEPILFEGLDTMPGAMVKMGFSTDGGGDTAATFVPVLDGGLSYYAPYVP